MPADIPQASNTDCLRAQVPGMLVQCGEALHHSRDTSAVVSYSHAEGERRRGDGEDDTTLKLCLCVRKDPLSLSEE